MFFKLITESTYVPPSCCPLCLFQNVANLHVIYEYSNLWCACIFPSCLVYSIKLSSWMIRLQLAACFFIHYMWYSWSRESTNCTILSKCSTVCLFMKKHSHCMLAWNLYLIDWNRTVISIIFTIIVEVIQSFIFH